MKTPLSTILRAILLGSFLVGAQAADQTVTGNLTVTGNVVANGTIDSDSNLLSFGTQGANPGVGLIYQDSSADTLTFYTQRYPASWVWVHNAPVSGTLPAMRLDSLHKLILYQADGSTIGAGLDPITNALSLGSATLTASGTALTTNGALTVGGNIANTTGSLTGGATGLTLNAGGTDQNITLVPSGTGVVTTAARVVITNTTASTSPATGALTVAGGVGINGRLHAGGVIMADANYSDNSLPSGLSPSMHIPMANNVTTSVFSMGDQSRAIVFRGLQNGGNALNLTIGGIPTGGAFVPFLTLNGSTTAAGTAAFASTASSTSTTTGSAIFAGGIGVNGAVSGKELRSYPTNAGDPALRLYNNVGIEKWQIFTDSANGDRFGLWSSANSARAFLVTSIGDGSFSSTTASSSPTTGALTVAGGLGIGGNTNIGGNVQVAHLAGGGVNAQSLGVEVRNGLYANFSNRPTTQPERGITLTQLGGLNYDDAMVSRNLVAVPNADTAQTLASAAYSAMVFRGSGRIDWLTGASSSAGTPFSPGPKMSLDSSGNVGIGTANPSSKLTVATTGTGIVPNIVSMGHVSGGQFMVSADSGGTHYLHSRWATYDPADARWEWTATTTTGAGMITFGTGTNSELAFDVKNSGPSIASQPVGFARALTLREDGAIVPGTLTVGGNFSAANYAATGGTITGGSTGLSLNAGGSAQNVTIAPSTTGEVRIVTSNANNSLLRLGNGITGTTAADGLELGVDAAGLGRVWSRDDALVFGVTGSERMRITSAGNVGIGTTTPEQLLDVNNGNTGTIKIGYLTTLGSTSQSANANSVLGWNVQATGADNNMRVLRDGYAPQAVYLSAAGLQFHTSSVAGTSGTVFSSERMRVSANGNVGIGTTTPSTKLEVAGISKFGGKLITEVTTGAGVTSELLTLQAAGGSNASGTATRISGYSDVINGYVDFKRFTASGPTTGLVLGTFGGDAITIRSQGAGDTGNVGIGTTTPTEKLEVAGNLKVTGTFSAANYMATSGTITGGSTGLALNAGGTNQNITLTPTGTGFVNTGANTMQAGSQGGGAGKTYIGTDGSNTAYIGTTNFLGLDVRPNGSTAARFATTGNLLLGATIDNSNGRLQLATHTTSAGGIGFGTDITLSRASAQQLNLSQPNANNDMVLQIGVPSTAVGNPMLELYAGSVQAYRIGVKSSDSTLRIDTGGGALGTNTVAKFGSSPSNGGLALTYTTTSTSTTTGALTVAGGVGVNGTVSGKEFRSYQTNAGDPALRLYNNTGTEKWQVFTDSANGDRFGLWSSAASARAFLVTSTGDASFAGTTASTSPTTGALTVAGGAGIAGDLNVGGTFTTANLSSGSATLANQTIRVQGSNSGTSIISNADQAASLFLTNKNGGANTFADLRFEDAGGNSVAGVAGIFVNDTANQGDLSFTTRDAGSSLSEKMRILGNGNVGIGITSPTSAKLVVASPQSTGNNTVIAEFTKSGGTNTYGSAILRLSRAIGNESADVELNSGGSGPFRYGTYADNLFVNNQNATNGVYGSTHFVTNSAVRMTIAGGTLAGNVGIGTATPSAKLAIAHTGGGSNRGLDVYQDYGTGVTGSYTAAYIDARFGAASSGNVTGLRVDTAQTGTGANYSAIFTGGNVGIGTTSPSYRLDVNGDARINGALYMGELYFSPLQTINLAIAPERWVKLATIPNNHYVRFQIRSGSQASEEIAELKVFGTYYNDQTGITVERQTYNDHLREVRVVGTNGGLKTVYIKIRASDYAPSVTWRALDSKGAITIHNTEETPSGGLAHLVTGNLITSTNTNIATTGNLSVSGTFSAANYSATGGTITGGSTGLTLSAGGTGNQNITITPTGTGSVLAGGNGALRARGNDANGWSLEASPNGTGVGVLLGTRFNTAAIGAIGGQSLVLAPDGGNVGIGTSTPSARLTIENPSNTETLRVRSSHGSPNTSVATFERVNNVSAANQSASNALLSIKEAGGYPFVITTSANSPIFGITPSGNVGIGTLSPSYPLEVNGSIRSNGGLLNTNNVFEKILPALSFSNGVANQAIDIRLGNLSFWGYLEVEITGDYSFQNTSGKLTKFFALGTNPNGSIYTNESRVADALGTIADNIAIGEMAWDAVNLTYKIPVSHIVSTGNAYTIKLRMFANAGGAAPVFNAAAVSSVYTLPALPRNYVNFTGNVGIGTAAPTHKLSVNGTIRAKEVIVDNTNWADYVFADDYPLAPLAEVEEHIKEKKHLPGIPSAAEVAEKGVNMGEMQALLLSKIEELTLHMIAQQKEIASLRKEVAELKGESAKQ